MDDFRNTFNDLMSQLGFSRFDPLAAELAAFRDAILDRGFTEEFAEDAALKILEWGLFCGIAGTGTTDGGNATHV